MNPSAQPPSCVPWEQHLEQRLAQRERQHLYRRRRLLQSAQGVEVVVEDCRYLNFCSNDYLGLANHPVVLSAFQQAANQYGVGSGASHLICGHSALHQQLEEALAAWVGRDRALLYSTGYMANIGLVTALLGKEDYLFQDKYNHASLLDAGLLCPATMRRFPHNNVAQLEQRLRQINAGRIMIAVDGVFSMQGNQADLVRLADLAARYHAYLVVDDAHGFGVLGTQGGGSAEAAGLDQQQLPVLMATLGKSLGCFGAFIAGSHHLIETLIQFSRTYIYTTALPPAVAAAVLASLQLLRREPQRRARLQQHIAYFKTGAKQRGIDLLPSQTAIQALLVGDNQHVLALDKQLMQQGFLVSAIRPPTVPVGGARLRITLSAEHKEEHIDRLLDCLMQIEHR